MAQVNPFHATFFLAQCNTLRRDVTAMSNTLDQLLRIYKRLKSYALNPSEVTAFDHRLYRVRAAHRQAVSYCEVVLWRFRQISDPQDGRFQDEWYKWRGYSMFKIEFELWVLKQRLRWIGKTLEGLRLRRERL